MEKSTGRAADVSTNETASLGSSGEASLGLALDHRGLPSGRKRWQKRNKEPRTVRALRRPQESASERLRDGESPRRLQRQAKPPPRVGQGKPGVLRNARSCGSACVAAERIPAKRLSRLRWSIRPLPSGLRFPAEGAVERRKGSLESWSARRALRHSEAACGYRAERSRSTRTSGQTSRPPGRH